MNDREIRLRMRLRTALRVGTGEGNTVTDAMIRRDSLGRPVIPGTSLAGALRSLATRLAPSLGWGECAALKPPDKSQRSRPKKPCGCPVCRLFGDIQCDERDTAPTTQASSEARAEAARLWVFDARPAFPTQEPAEGTRTDIRDGVGIDRASGSAYSQGRTKFDQEVLPAGAEFELRLELEATLDPDEANLQERLLAATLSEWVAGRAAIGGGTGRGFGAIEACGQPEYRKLDFSEAGNFFTYLSQDGPWDSVAPQSGWLETRLRDVVPAASRGDGWASCWAVLEAEVSARSFLLLADPLTGGESSFDHAPLLASADRNRPILSGSSLRGALRSQAERIARTLRSFKIVESDDASVHARRFRESCPACNPLVRAADQPLISCDALLSMESDDGRPLLKTYEEARDENLCLACRLFGSARRGSRLRVEDAEIEDPKYKPLDFLAIDRFTGGGADHLKFDACALWRPRFSVRIFLENAARWELGWLLLALRDIQDGLATLGYGGAKGFGEISADSWRLSLGFLTPEDASKLGVRFADDGPRDGLFAVWEARSENAVENLPLFNGWVEEFRKLAESGVNRGASGNGDSKLPPLPKDTYFGEAAQSLYPLRGDQHG